MGKRKGLAALASANPSSSVTIPNDSARLASITREIAARVLRFRTVVARARQSNQFGEMLPCLVTVAGLRRRLPRAVQSTITIRLALLGGFILPESVSRALQLQQHVTEQLARWQQPPRRDDVLFAPVLDVRGLAHEADGFIRPILRQRDPGDGGHSHHLNLVRPVLVLRDLQSVTQRHDLIDVLLRPS